MFQGIVKPLLSDQQKSPASARQFIDPLRKVNPQLASAIERLQQSADFTLNALRTEPQQADEIIFTDAQGNVIFWVGSRDGYFGGWFGQLYVGGTGPVNANLFVDNTGLLTIRDALITLTSGAKEIRLDPTGPIFRVVDTDAQLTIGGLGDVVRISGSHTTNLSGFSIDTDGRISITSTSDSNYASISASQYGSTAYPVGEFYTAGGDPSSASAISAGRGLGATSYYGHDGTTFQLAGTTSVKAKAVSGGSVTSTVTHDYDEYLFNSGGLTQVQFLGADKLVFGAGTNTTGYEVDFEKRVCFQDNIRLDGTMLFNALTASRILKLNGSKVATADKINLDSANDVALTGASSGDVLKWGGTSAGYYTLSDLAAALKTYLDSYYSSATHTHNMAVAAATDVASGHSHTLSAVSTAQPI